MPENSQRISPAEYENFVLSLFFRNEGDISKDVAHAVLGISTELMEMMSAVDETNLIEEMGDLLFFGVALDSRLAEFMESAGAEDHVAIPPPLSNVLAMDLMQVMLRLAKEIGPAFDDEDHNAPLKPGDAGLSLMNMVKKWVGYGAAPSQKQALNVASLNFLLTVGAILNAAQRAGMDVDAVFQKVAAANMRKLRERYKAGFNLKDAESRDRDAERAALERTERLAAAPQRGGKERD